MNIDIVDLYFPRATPVPGGLRPFVTVFFFAGTGLATSAGGGRPKGLKFITEKRLRAEIASAVMKLKNASSKSEFLTLGKNSLQFPDRWSSS